MSQGGILPAHGRVFGAVPYATVCALALVSMGASCGGGESGGGSGGGGGSEAPPAPRVDAIPSVDLSDLTSGERRIFYGLVNDLLSPCGEPVSVARCAVTEGSCRTCRPAVRYVARLIGDGFERSDIEEAYDARYGRDTMVDLPLDGHPSRGAPMARVTIAIFSDFECPYCGRAHPVLEEVLRELEGDVRVVFFHYPLPAHPHAAAAARAAVAAERQGRFWEMHDVLFDHQLQLTDADLERYATEIGLDLERFHADLASPEVAARVEADRAAGREVEIEGTPTLFINGRRYSEPPSALMAYVREELEL